MAKNNFVVIFITCASLKEARRLATELVKNKLAACVNIVDRIESVFWWQGKVDKAKEILLIVKSRKAKLPLLIKKIKHVHSYEIPEIIALAIMGGYKPYLNWWDESLRRER